MTTPNMCFAPSPSTVMPPNALDQYFANSHCVSSNGATQTPGSLSNLFTPTGSIPPTPGSLAGRKRSRDDSYTDDEEPTQLEDGAIVTPVDDEVAKPRGRPIYGPGMTLIYPEDPGYMAAAESQSGTWVEERAERKPFHLAHGKRPSVSSRKSMRKDGLASAPDDLAQLVLPPQLREATAEPLIDEATRVLGISWTRMDSTEVLRINQGAYGKWIQNHYPCLKDVTVWFENSAIPGYLVAARNAYSGQQAYYIFSDSLAEARLVTTEPAQLVPRLKMLPALELAAPGGHLIAETDLAAVVGPEADGLSHADVTGFSKDSDPRHAHNTWAETVAVNGIGTAHEMELD